MVVATYFCGYLLALDISIRKTAILYKLVSQVYNNSNVCFVYK